MARYRVFFPFDNFDQSGKSFGRINWGNKLEYRLFINWIEEFFSQNSFYSFSLAENSVKIGQKHEGGRGIRRSDEDPRSLSTFVVAAIYVSGHVTGARTGMRHENLFSLFDSVLCARCCLQLFSQLKRKGDFSRDKSESNREPKRPIDQFLRSMLFILSLSLLFFPIRMILLLIHFFIVCSVRSRRTESINFSCFFLFFFYSVHTIFNNKHRDIEIGSMSRQNYNACSTYDPAETF